tara:strand:- start:269 stop:1432 length:1164 start_codon:yes stop_codon:yes gene_type:complete
MVEKIIGDMNNELNRAILIILIFVCIVMNIFQYRLDKTRDISVHSYIRNVAIVFTIYYLINYNWIWIVFAIPFIVELIIEIGHTYDYFQLDPVENKTINCYNSFERISRAHPELDYYTEGKFDGDMSLSMKEAQDNKFKWMCDEGNIEEGTRVLDIGSGRCDFLFYAKNKRGAKATGCTISPDQIETCDKKKIPLFIIDITNDEIPEEYKGKFDVLVFNGSAEHFRQANNQKSTDEFWKDFFKKIEVLFDPKSKNKRIVITMIHHRDREKSMKEKIHAWLLDKGFGGSYPQGKNGLVRNAENYKVLKMLDATKEYLQYSEKFGKISEGVLSKILYNNLIDLPVLLINNPYYFHHIFSVMYSWKSQFMPVDGKEPPMLHQWIILQLNK